MLDKKYKKIGRYFFIAISLIALIVFVIIFLNFKYSLLNFLVNKNNASNGSIIINKSAVLTNVAGDPLIEKASDFYKKYIRQHDAYVGQGETPVIVFCDFTLPACQQVWSVLAKIRNNQPELLTDKMVLAWKNFLVPTNSNSKLAAEAALCAKEQGKFWQYGDLLFANQENINEKNTIKWALELDLDKEDFEACLSSGKMLESIGYDMEDAEKLYIDGLPYILIGSKRLEKDNFIELEQSLAEIK
ncbi:MAG TPA: thioredoxin domain-containing protein [bacterium]|nr:thioredoxin domain-containing protein [bacterium]